MTLLESYGYSLHLFRIPGCYDLDQLPDKFCRKYSSTDYSKFLLLYDRKIRCILESGTEMFSTEVEYESNSNKMMATHVYLSFQHVSRVPGLGTLSVNKTERLCLFYVTTLFN